MVAWSMIEIQSIFLTGHSTQIKSVISVPIKDFINQYPRAMLNGMPRVGMSFYYIPKSRHTFTTTPGRANEEMLNIMWRHAAGCTDVEACILLVGAKDSTISRS